MSSFFKKRRSTKKGAALLADEQHDVSCGPIDPMAPLMAPPAVAESPPMCGPSASATTSSKHLPRTPVPPRRAEEQGQLLVGVRSASDLAAVNIGGRSSDPFVKVLVRTPSDKPMERKTRSVTKSLDPVWEEELSFRDVHGDGELPAIEISIWDVSERTSSDPRQPSAMASVRAGSLLSASLGRTPWVYPLRRTRPSVSTRSSPSAGCVCATSRR
jgi:hypothetical protein